MKRDRKESGVANVGRHQLTGAGDTELSRLEPESSPSLLRWFFSGSKSVVAVVLQCLCPVAIIFAGIGYFDFRRSVIDSSPSVTEVVLSAILLGVLIITIFLLAGGFFNRRKFLRSHGNQECS